MKTPIITTIWTTAVLVALVVSSACAGPVTKAPTSVVTPAVAQRTAPASPAAPTPEPAPIGPVAQTPAPTAPAPTAPAQKPMPKAGDPAAITYTNFKISPSTVKAGEMVKVTIDVTNTGVNQNWAVVLKVDGKVVDELGLTCKIDIDCDETKEASFNITMVSPGTYTLTIGDQSGKLVVR